MTNTRAKPSNRRGGHPGGPQPKASHYVAGWHEFWPIGGVAYGRQGTGQLPADRLSVSKCSGRR
jgi:hypothetical protein